MIFTIVFRCFHCWLHLFTSLFLQVIKFYTGFAIVFRVFWFHQLSLTWPSFVRYYVFVLLYCECYGLRDLFSISGVFYLTLLPSIWHNLLLWRLPWGQQFSLEDCRASRLPAIQPWRLQGRSSNHRPGQCVCLNHTVFSQRY